MSIFSCVQTNIYVLTNLFLPSLSASFPPLVIFHLCLFFFLSKGPWKLVFFFFFLIIPAEKFLFLSLVLLFNFVYIDFHIEMFTIWHQIYSFFSLWLCLMLRKLSLTLGLYRKKILPCFFLVLLWFYFTSLNA